MALRAAKPLDDYTESQWDGELFRGDESLAAMLGWRFRYHVIRSKGSQAGFPDRVLVRERVVYVETKSEKGKPTVEQVAWLDALALAGEECYLWRPSDLDEVARVLSKRWQLDRALPPNPSHLVVSGERWAPNSLWIPNHGRSDGK